MSNTLELAKELIQRPSVTPEDAGCQNLLSERLKVLGFELHSLRYDDVDNLWAIRGESGPLFCFAGHTDVVPAGDLSQWATDPFQPQVIDGMLYGRGAADMKGSIAAMVTAVERFVAGHPDHNGRLAFLITSDEEGIAINGTVKVVEWLEDNNEKITWCLVGEPSSTAKLGDVVKNGRRGSLGAKLTVLGKQGHVAYPHLASNPIHAVAPALADLANEIWDEGNAFFPATSFQISNINGGTGATNVIPGTVSIIFNFRFSTEQTPELLQSRTETILNKYGLDYELTWALSGLPFITEKGPLVNATTSAIKQCANIDTEISTAGGTSDGRFIAPTGAQVIELGPVNATIHQINECVDVRDLDTLSTTYEAILENLLVTDS